MEGARRCATSMGERECAAEGIGEGGRRESAEVLAMVADVFASRNEWQEAENGERRSGKARIALS